MDHSRKICEWSVGVGATLVGIQCCILVMPFNLFKFLGGTPKKVTQPPVTLFLGIALTMGESFHNYS